MLLASGIANALVVAVGVVDFPTTVTAGQRGIPVSIRLRNANTAPDDTSTNLVCNSGDASPCAGGGIVLRPSCGLTPNASGCPAGGAEASVFDLPDTATGAAGTACEGVTFSITEIVAGEAWRFVPQSVANVVLVGTNASCRIDFTVGVLRVPSLDTAPATPGVQTFQALTHAQRSGAVLASSVASDNTTVAGATPALVTMASAGGVIGTAVNDTATLSGGVNPTGTVTFRLYSDASCTVQVFTSTNSLVGSSGATSGNFTPASPGTYRWIATYNGDANNNAVAAPCNAPNESVTIERASPGISTMASAGGPVGTQVNDTATLTGGQAPSGTVTFRLYSDASCTAQVFTSTNAVAGATATSSGFTPPAAGTYRWIAAYSGDVNNFGISGSCNAPNESVTIGTIVTLATNASAGVVLGGQVSDTATLTGGSSPTGTVTFDLFGPDDATCASTPVFTSTVAVASGGTATSAAFTPIARGTYRWIARYSGDAAHAPVAAICNAANESVAVVAPDAIFGNGFE